MEKCKCGTCFFCLIKIKEIIIKKIDLEIQDNNI